MEYVIPKPKVKHSLLFFLSLAHKLSIMSLIIIVILAGIAAGLVADKLGKINVEEIDKTAIGISEETKEELSGYRNIALLGIDSRADDYGLGNRSDCIIIASMDQIHPDITYALFPASVDKVLKKELGKKGTVEVKIPVRFADNHIEEYTLIYSRWYEMPQID